MVLNSTNQFRFSFWNYNTESLLLKVQKKVIWLLIKIGDIILLPILDPRKLTKFKVLNS